MPAKPLVRLPPCPDPNSYILVKTRKGYFWRRKRGTVKPITLNSSFKENNDLGKPSFAAARRILTSLRPYMLNFETGFLQLHLANALRRSLKAFGEFKMEFLQEMEFQPRRPLNRLFSDPYTVNKKADSVNVSLTVSKNCVKRHSKDLGHFYFEIIILYGDCSRDHGLRTETAQSRLLSFSEIEEGTPKQTVELELLLPDKKPWLLLLKVASLYYDGGEPGNVSSAMKVIASS